LCSSIRICDKIYDVRCFHHPLQVSKLRVDSLFLLMENPPLTTFTTTDNFTLHGTLFEPASSNQRFVLISSAMPVKRGFYAKYAAYLASKGFTVLTYDYRGIGDSRPASLRGFQAHLWQWGALDFAAAVRWVRAQYPNHKLLAVGHSMGGQVLGLT